MGILSGSLFIAALSFGQSSGNLVLNKGQKFLVENKVTANSTQEMMGQTMDSKADIFTSNNFEVKDTKDNNYNLTNTFTKVTAAMSAMGQDMNFDSDKKEDMDGEMGSSMKDFINHPKDILVDKTGKILTEKKVDSSAKGSGMMSMMMNQFLGNSEEAGLNTFRIIPKKSGAGYSWTDSSSNDGIKKITTYNIKEIKGSDAIIDITGTLNTDTKSEMQGMEISSKTTGTLKGEETVDINTGIVKQRTTTIESKGNIEAMGQNLPMSTKLTTVTSVKKM